MKVTEFFVGFGPRLWSFKRGETEYGVKAVPLGGYCRIIGMTNLEEVDARRRAARVPLEGATCRSVRVVAAPVPAVHFVDRVRLDVLRCCSSPATAARASAHDDARTRCRSAPQQAGLKAGDNVVVDRRHARSHKWEQVAGLIADGNAQGRRPDPDRRPARRRAHRQRRSRSPRSGRSAGRRAVVGRDLREVARTASRRSSGRSRWRPARSSIVGTAVGQRARSDLLAVGHREVLPRAHRRPTRATADRPQRFLSPVGFAPGRDRTR